MKWLFTFKNVYAEAAEWSEKNIYVNIINQNYAHIIIYNIFFIRVAIVGINEVVGMGPTLTYNI